MDMQVIAGVELSRVAGLFMMLNLFWVVHRAFFFRGILATYVLASGYSLERASLARFMSPVAFFCAG